MHSQQYLQAAVSVFLIFASVGIVLAIEGADNSAASRPALAGAIGQLYMPRADAKFLVSREEVRPDRVRHPLCVERLHGEWMWVGTAWIRHREVLPLQLAADYYTLYLHDHPDDGWAYHCRAICRREQADLTGAIADLSEAIRLNPHSASEYNSRGNIWMLQSRFATALVDYQHAIALDTTCAFAFANRGVAHEKLGKYKNALLDYERAIQLNPRDPTAPCALAWLLSTCPDARHRNGDRAVPLATRACELSAWRLADPIDTLAAAHAECEDFDLAIQYQQQAISAGATNLAYLRSANRRLEMYRAKVSYRQEGRGDFESEPSVFHLLTDGPSPPSSRPPIILHP